MSRGGADGAMIGKSGSYLPIFAMGVATVAVTIALLGVVFEFAFSVLERRTIVRWGMQRS